MIYIVPTLLPIDHYIKLVSQLVVYYSLIHFLNIVVTTIHLYLDHCKSSFLAYCIDVVVM